MKSFTRRVEDFTCAHCGARVVGNGYTNHCPRCLWSRHVDINPGDRASTCGGMMRPISATPAGDGFKIVHKCDVCGHIRTQHSAPNDDIDAIIAVSRNDDFVFGK